MSHDPLPDTSPEAARVLGWLKGLVAFGSSGRQGRFLQPTCPYTVPPWEPVFPFSCPLSPLLSFSPFLPVFALLPQVKPQTRQGLSGSPDVTRGSSK